MVEASGSTVLSSSGEISVEASTDKTSAILLQGQESTLDEYQTNRVIKELLCTLVKIRKELHRTTIPRGCFKK
jgi:hypothetical protein